MENHYPASSNEPLSFDDEEVENLDTLSPGQVPTPVRVGRTGRVATSISITELPVPTIYTKADTASKREAFRRTNHAMLHHPIVDDERGDRMDRIAASLRSSLNQQYPSKATYQNYSTNPRFYEEDLNNLYSNVLLGLGVVILGAAGLYLAYRAIKYMSYAEAAVVAAVPSVPT